MMVSPLMKLLIKIFFPIFLICSCEKNSLEPQFGEQITEIDNSISKNYPYGDWSVDNYKFSVNGTTTICSYENNEFYCEREGLSIKSKFKNKIVYSFNKDGTYIFKLDKDVVENISKGNWWTIDNKIIIQDMDPIYNREEMFFSIDDGILELIFLPKNRPNEHLEMYFNENTNPSS